MDNFPDFTQYGYQVKEQLGRNREGGRITWKGENLVQGETVIIKQFCFAVSDSTWSGYKAYEQEINILQQLDHPGIPRYLDGIETENGFCLIQQYIQASSLNNCRSLTKKEIGRIASELLEILVYLQQQSPPVLHRDIKPENILVNDELEVYLIDFGFASLGCNDVSGSSVFKGTPGFIAPEQIVKPTLASDLYSLGVSIVCLLANKNITEIQNLLSVDNPYQLNLQFLLPDLDSKFRFWLEKMTDAQVTQRFPNALIARDALRAIDATSLSNESLTLTNQVKINNLDKIKVPVATSAMVALSFIAVWGINFADRNVESTGINIAIAILAAIVIGITQLSAIEIVKADALARFQGGILSVSVPILLVGASAIIWGVGEAVDIAATTIIAEVLILSYFALQLPWLQQKMASLVWAFC